MIDLHTHSTASDGSLVPKEVVELAKEMGLQAVALTDHNTTADRLENIYLPIAKEAGLIAMEVMHCSYTVDKIETAKSLADKFSLLYSGGSDFHGSYKENVLLGTGTNNNVRVDYSILEKLKNEL